jgi:prevent-host-death family protein
MMRFMATVNVHEAKTHLSSLLVRVARGERVVIARAGTPIAVLIPFGAQPAERVAGRDRGLVYIASDFDDPLPEFEA